MEEKNYKNWSDLEILEYIKENFKEITGVEYREIFTTPKDDGQDRPIFDQTIIFETYPTIKELLFEKFDKNQVFLDKFLYLMDEEFSKDAPDSYE